MWKLWRKNKQQPKSEPQPVVQPKPPQRYQAVMRAGRRFVESTYLLPKDSQEMNRLDFQHYLLHQAFRGNYLAPICQPQYILDVGCGTGKWGREMALAFPQAHVMGIDIEQANSTGPIPGNYLFVQGNVLERLPVANNTFHFVHQRLLVGAIPAIKWPDVMRELVRVTKHGGWIELVESGCETVNPGPRTTQFFQWGQEASLLHGIDARMIVHLDERLREQGLLHVTRGHVDIPIGPWGGRIGTLMQEDLLSSFAALEALFTQTGSADDFHELLALLPTEWERFRTFYRFFYYYGQK